MRTRYALGGRSTDPGHGQALFGSAGWLFADLMLAIAMAFLVANTFGLPASPPVHKHRTAVRPKPTHTAQPALELQPFVVKLTVNVGGLEGNAPSAFAAVRNVIRSETQLSGRHAGLVLSFGGDNDFDTSRAIEMANKVDEVLQGLGNQGFVFTGTVYRPFIALNEPPDYVELDIYLFKPQPAGS
jgi:hypothetical protein